jgi:hypothetical protein
MFGFSKFQSWLDHKLKTTDVYELCGKEIVCGRGRLSEHRLPVAKLKSWQVHPEMGFDLVFIKLVDGETRQWPDTYNDLVAILRGVAPEKEEKSTTVL